MSQDRQTNVALLIDFDNVALGARDAGQRFDIKMLIERILEKGKVLVKKAYADWHYYKEHMSPLHEAAVELIEIPMPKISGKNSADIKLVVDAMDLCYSKDHINTFVIVSGDSDFSPLVSKLRENNKWVIGIGVKNSSSKLLIGNCDEFIFYDDIFRQQVRQSGRRVKNVPEEKREIFDFLVTTTQSLLQESKGVLYSSLIKDTMTRKRPDFNERAHGYSNFGDLLEDARNMGLLLVERDAHAGGTWVVHGLANGSAEASGESGGSAPSRSSRRRRRSSRGRGSGSREAAAPATDPATNPAHEASAESSEKTPGKSERAPDTKPDPVPIDAAPESVDKPVTKKKTTRTSPARKAVSKKAPAKKTTKKAPAKKTTTKKAPAKKTLAKKTPAKKTTRKAPAKKAPAKKTPAKKATKKTPVRKTTKKAPAGD